MSNNVPAAKQADSVLTEHAVEIRRLHKRVAGDVIEIGRRLSECKRICGHGNWLPWLDREFGWTDDTALNFMRVYELSRKSRNFRDLCLPISALYLLAAPSTPETARAECFKRAEAGEVIQLPEVKRTIEEAKKIAKAHQLPTAKDANVQAKEEGRLVLARDGFIYFGTDPGRAKEGEDRRTMVYGVRRALDTLGNIQLTGRQFLDYALPHQLWDENEAKIIKQALRWLTSLADAFAGKNVSATAFANNGVPSPRDDIGPDSASEADRLRARNEELERGNHRLARENRALRAEIEELKAELAKRAPIDDDGIKEATNDAR